MRAALALIFVVLASLMLAQPHRAEPAAQEQALPKIAPAPEFALISQDGAPVKLADYRGKVVAVTFIFTLCADTCPVLTPMMSFVQDQLGADFGEKIALRVDHRRSRARHAGGAQGVCAGVRRQSRRAGAF